MINIMDKELFRLIEELPPVVTAEQIAELLAVSRQTVVRWGDEGLIPVLQPSDRTTRFLREDVRAFLATSYNSKPR